MYISACLTLLNKLNNTTHKPCLTLLVVQSRSSSKAANSLAKSGNP